MYTLHQYHDHLMRQGYSHEEAEDLVAAEADRMVDREKDRDLFNDNKDESK